VWILNAENIATNFIRIAEKIRILLIWAVDWLPARLGWAVRCTLDAQRQCDAELPKNTTATCHSTDDRLQCGASTRYGKLPDCMAGQKKSHHHHRKELNTVAFDGTE
jgi:hypothetical protein